MSASIGSQNRVGSFGAFVGSMSGLDPDAQSFISTSGAVDVVGINQFVTGIKDLGLWSSMVCWPLRSTQNAGTGTTVYSLGGLSPLNGTMVNGPTWGVNGLTMAAASSQYVAFPTMANFTSGIYCGSVHSVSSFVGSNRGIEIGLSSGSPTGGIWAPFNDGNMYWDCLNSVGGGRVSGVSGASLNTFYLWSGSSFGTACYRNSTQIATGGTPVLMSSTFDRIQFGRSLALSAFTGTSAFIFIIRSPVTSAINTQFFDLYKSSIGTGLGLP